MSEIVRVALIFVILGGLLGSVNAEMVEDSNGALEWSKTFGSHHLRDDYAKSVVQTADGGYIIAGTTSSYGAGKNDVWLIKTDSNGNEEWDKTYGGKHGDDANAVEQTTDGGYILAGITSSYGAGKNDAWLIKTDSTGNEEWNTTFGGIGRDSASSVEQTADGGYIIAGFTSSYGADVAWLIKTDSTGNEEWNKTFLGTGMDYWFRSGGQTADGGYIVAGSTFSFGLGLYIWLIKTDSTGNEEWNKTFLGYGGRSVEQTADGGYIIAGGDHDACWLVKTDFRGNKLWYRTFGGIGRDSAYSVEQTADGGYILAGTTSSYGAGEGDIWLIKTDSNGNEEWDKTFGGIANDFASSVKQTADGGYIIAGGLSRFYGVGDDEDEDDPTRRSVANVSLLKVKKDLPKQISTRTLPLEKTVGDGDWPMFRHDLQHTGATDETIPDKLKLIWSYHTGSSGGGETPVISNGKVFGGSCRGVYCLDADTGDLLRNFKIEGSVESSPALYESKVVVGTQGRIGTIVFLNANSGAVIWRYETEGGVISSPAVYDGKVFAVSTSKFYCLNVDTCEPIWSYEMNGGKSSPAVYDGKVFVGSDDGNVYCLNADTGELIWSYETEDRVDSSPAVSDGKVFVGSFDENVYCLNADTGVLIWRYETGGMVHSSPAVSDDKVYIGSDDGILYCLDADTGELIWRYDTGDWVVDSSPAVSGGKVFAGSNRKIYCLNADTGEFIWKYKTGSRSFPVVSEGKVFVMADKLYCFGSKPTLQIPFISKVTGFEIIFIIAGLVAVACLIKWKRALKRR